jgi:predicted AAA+ superfamily ATPase
VLGIKSYPEIFLHPKAGASFEGFAIEQIIKVHQTDDCYFWATHNKAELDLLIIKNGRRIGFEFKLSDSPKITPSMRIAYEDLNLDELNVIYPKGRSYPLSELITVYSLADYVSKNNNTSSLKGES